MLPEQTEHCELCGGPCKPLAAFLAHVWQHREALNPYGPFVAEYVGEAQHQNGPEYWHTATTVELVYDLQQYVFYGHNIGPEPLPPA